MQFSLREIRAALREVLAKWAELLTDGDLGGDLFEMHRGDLAKELAPWAGHGDKFLKALRLAYVLGTEHALAIAVKTAMGDDEDLQVSGAVGVYRMPRSKVVSPGISS